VASQNSHSAVELRTQLAEAWAELETWIQASDAWTEAKEHSDPPPPSTPDTPAGSLSPKKMDAVEEWRHLFRDELDSVKKTVGSIPARTRQELEQSVAAARELLKIPRRGFK
jgi:hypothetical protein